MGDDRKIYRVTVAEFYRHHSDLERVTLQTVAKVDRHFNKIENIAPAKYTRNLNSRTDERAVRKCEYQCETTSKISQYETIQSFSASGVKVSKI